MSDIFRACLSGEITAIEDYIKSGGDVDIVGGSKGWSLLFSAALYGRSQAVSVLISAGANIHWKDEYRRTAAHNAAHNNEIGTLKILLDAGASMEDKDVDGQTPTQMAVEQGPSGIETLMSLVESGHLKDKNYGIVGMYAVMNQFETALWFMKSGVQFTKAELTVLFDSIYSFNATTAREDLIEFLDKSLKKKDMKAGDRQEKLTKVLKLSSRTRPGLKSGLDSVDSRFAISKGSFIVKSFIVVILAIVSISFHGLDIYTDVDFSMSLLDKSELDQTVVKEELVNCTRMVDQEFLEVVNAFMDNGNKIYSPDNEEFGLNLTERITNTSSGYSNCFNTENRFRSNPKEWRISSIFSIIHICFPLIAATIIWFVILSRQKKDVSCFMWFTWNLPWLPFTKFYEVLLHIRSLYLDFDREIDRLSYALKQREKEAKAELAAMREQNANTGKH